MVNTWKFYITHNSTTPPCGGSSNSLVELTLNSYPKAVFGCYNSSESDTAIMQDILQPGMVYLPRGITYAVTDIVYLNDILFSTPSNYIDIIIEPNSNYNPDSAIVAIIGKLTDMAGLITNVLTKFNIINYQYLGTEFFKSGNNVVLRINLLHVGA